MIEFEPRAADIAKEKLLVALMPLLDKSLHSGDLEPAIAIASAIEYIDEGHWPDAFEAIEHWREAPRRGPYGGDAA
jgi:hypothetical protein